MESGGTHKLQLKTVDQISIAVKDIDEVIQTWSSMFGIGPWTFADTDTTDSEGHPYKARLAFAYLGSVQIELIQPGEGLRLHSDFLETVGEGLHHLGFRVDDVDGEASNLSAQGAKVLLANPGRFAYMETGGPGGVIFEVIKGPS